MVSRIRQRSKLKKREKSGRAFSGDCKFPLEACKYMDENRNDNSKNSTVPNGNNLFELLKCLNSFLTMDLKRQCSVSGSIFIWRLVDSVIM